MPNKVTCAGSKDYSLIALEPCLSLLASLMAQMVKNLPSMPETQVQSLGQEDPLEKGMATHNPLSRQVFLPGEFHAPEEPGGLQSMRSQKVGPTEQLHSSKPSTRSLTCLDGRGVWGRMLLLLLLSRFSRVRLCVTP